MTQGINVDGWLEQLRRGGLDLAILATVSTGPRYGLSIIQHLEEFTDLVINEGTIYPILGRLTRQGLLEASWVQDQSPHPRKYYRLTTTGHSALAAMQTEWRSFARKIERLLAAAEKESSAHDGP